VHPTCLAAAVERVVDVEPSSVLEVGAALGTSGALLREALDVPAGGLERAGWRTQVDAVLAPGVAPGPHHGVLYDRVVPLDDDRTYDVVLVTGAIGRAAARETLAPLLARARRRLVLVAPTDGPGAEAWSLRDLRGFRADAALVGPPGARAFVATLAPDGAPRAWVPGAARPALARCDALWDGPPPARRPLTVAYLVPHHQITGGIKILVEHMARLRARGHRVRAVARGDAPSAVPPWAKLRVDEDVVVPFGAPFAPALRGAGVAVVGWHSALPELLDAEVPVLHLEQGHEVLFGDVPDTAQGQAAARAYAATASLPFAWATVSPFAASVVRDLCGRRCGLVPNGVDAARFAVRPAAPARGRVLLVGNAALPFKGFEVALRALARVAQAVPHLKVTWVTQVPPRLPALPFRVDVVLNPPQGNLPGLYQASDAFLFASWYEAFGLPPLEAMASGLAVVATRCGGIEAYARDGENCLLAPVGDDAGLAEHLLRALREPALAARLGAAARATAEAFGWDRAIDALEDALLRVAGQGASAAARPAR
jgi:glycosyltransferase involved in cell wall biosynthesis